MYRLVPFTTRTHVLSRSSTSFQRSMVCTRLLSTSGPGTSSDSDASNSDIRASLLAELKQAMKSRDAFKSTTIRSVLSEVYAADKVSSQTVSSSAIVAIVRKAVSRRVDSASVFTKGDRADLAEKELREVAVLEALLPPLLSEADIDRAMAEVMTSEPVVEVLQAKGPSPKALGVIFAGFYGKVDKSSVDPNLVKQRAQALLAAHSR